MNAVKKITAMLSALIVLLSAVSVRADDSHPYYIKINRQTQVTTIYAKDESGNYTVPYKAMICAPGAGGNTPLGIYKTPEKYRWKELLGGVWGQYSTRFAGGCLFHSACYRRPDESTLITKTFNSLGRKESLGCVRLSVADAKWIYDNCPLGTTVEVMDSPTDPLPRPVPIKLTANSTYPTWDPTDPNPNNPWKKEQVKIIINEPKKFVKKGDEYAYNNLAEILHDGVTAYDIANNVIHYDISCNVDVNTPGEYIIKYFATDCLGNYNENLARLVVLE
ncbi:MAG: L,D-transpeptidase family protein [Firmicutes bacterium]|nr:L,D-transpeptidase family protein [Bacillota bacterium]